MEVMRAGSWAGRGRFSATPLRGALANFPEVPSLRVHRVRSTRRRRVFDVLLSIAGWSMAFPISHHRTVVLGNGNRDRILRMSMSQAYVGPPGSAGILPRVHNRDGRCRPTSAVRLYSIQRLISTIAVIRHNHGQSSEHATWTTVCAAFKP